MTQAQVIDLANLDTTAACDAGAEIELTHPVTRAPLDIHWSVLGRDSTAVQDFLRRRTNEDIRRAAQAQKRGKEPEVMTAEKQEARGIDLLVAASTGWRTGNEPTLTMDGERLAFTAENARKVLTRMKWIKAQVDEGAADLENFMKA